LADPLRPDREHQPIELRVREVGQLFHSLDPLPFRERDLDTDVEDYVIGWARELPADQSIRIIIRLPQTEIDRQPAAQTAEAIRNYFAERAEAVTRDLRELFRMGRVALLISMAVLGVCIVLSTVARAVLGSGWLGRFFDEGLVILGWVANWYPMQIFLYDWWPLVRRRRRLRRLAVAEISLIPAPADAGADRQ